MGTKPLLSNWSAEKIAKLFTSAGIHRHIHIHAHSHSHNHAYTHIWSLLSQSVQSSLGNVHSSILSFIHPLSFGSSFPFSSIGPITTARDPNPWNRTSPHTHKQTHTSLSHSPASTVTKGQAVLAFWYLPYAFLCVRVSA